MRGRLREHRVGERTVEGPWPADSRFARRPRVWANLRETARKAGEHAEPRPLEERSVTRAAARRGVTQLLSAAHYLETFALRRRTSRAQDQVCPWHRRAILDRYQYPVGDAQDGARKRSRPSAWERIGRAKTSRNPPLSPAPDSSAKGRFAGIRSRRHRKAT